MPNGSGSKIPVAGLVKTREMGGSTNCHGLSSLLHYIPPPDIRLTLRAALHLSSPGFWWGQIYSTCQGLISAWTRVSPHSKTSVAYKDIFSFFPNALPPWNRIRKIDVHGGFSIAQDLCSYSKFFRRAWFPVSEYHPPPLFL